jgi:hemerythrin
MIAWTPSLSVGIEEIDAQHKELFRRADAFLTGLETRSREEVGMLLSFLQRYAVMHFGEEESWMRKFAYPDYRAHKAQHDKFLRDLEALFVEHGRRGGPGLKPMRVATWLGRWLMDHVSISDVGLAQFVISRSA